MMVTPLRVLLVLGALLVGVLTTAAPGDPFGRGALRSVVTACMISKSTLGLSFPCTDVKLDSPAGEGYAVIRSPGFASEFLLSPLAAYDGIESPQLQTDRATGLWQAAWNMRGDVDAALGRTLPRTELALAVNASGTRTQDHFHIHLDCLRQSVGRALQVRRASITPEWNRLRTPLRGKLYWARSIAGADLDGVNIPRLVAAAPPAATNAMDRVTLAVVGATLADGSEGFYLLANWQNASAERLLDHQCRQS